MCKIDTKINQKAIFGLSKRMGGCGIAKSEVSDNKGRRGPVFVLWLSLLPKAGRKGHVVYIDRIGIVRDIVRMHGNGEWHFEYVSLGTVDMEWIDMNERNAGYVMEKAG